MRLQTAGEMIEVDSTLGWVIGLVQRAAGPGTAEPGEPTVRVRVEAANQPFERTSLRTVTRGAYSDGTRTLLLDCGGSGFDLLVTAEPDTVEITARYRPSRAVRAANLALGRRFGLLAGQILVHYPVLWRAGWRGRVPLHAAVFHSAPGTALLAGPGGVGKSTVMMGALADEATTATADNVCSGDGTSCFGLAEPVRTDAAGARGRRTSHGRVETSLTHRVPRLQPDRVIVLERGPRTEISAIKPDEAARALTAGTYAAGELRRYWAFAATLGLATGRGPVHPPIGDVASAYAERLPCVRVRVGDGAAVSMTDMFAEVTN
jgi:hypothetical protein